MGGSALLRALRRSCFVYRGQRWASGGEKERSSAMLEKDKHPAMMEERISAMLEKDKHPAMMEERISAMLEKDKHNTTMMEERSPGMKEERIPFMIKEERISAMLEKDKHPTMMEEGRISAMLEKDKHPTMMEERTPAIMKEDRISAMLEEAYTADTEEEDEPSRAPRRSPADSTVVLFPGQGSQAVGMAGGLLKYPNVREMFLTAHKVLGYDLLELCLRGPADVLDKTVHCQPAMFVTSVAATERLTQESPEALEQCIAVAGFSVGEFAALVFSGALDFTEALYAVKVRAEAMQEASDAVPSGMISVIGTAKTTYKTACSDAREHCLTLGITDPVCEVANYLFPNGRVIAGHMEAIQFLQNNSRKYKFSRTKLLPVSGAFHTRLMAPAVEPLEEALKGLTFQRPLVSVYSNVDGKKYRQASAIPRLLAQQLVSPVKWEQTMHTIYERRRGQDFPKTYELGPGGQLGTILKTCNLKAWHSYSQVDVFDREQMEEEVD